jgi:hypothetical protein
MLVSAWIAKYIRGFGVYQATAAPYGRNGAIHHPVDHLRSSAVIIDTAAWLVLVPIIIVGLAVWRVRP